MTHIRYMVEKNRRYTARKGTTCIKKVKNQKCIHRSITQLQVTREICKEKNHLSVLYLQRYIVKVIWPCVGYIICTRRILNGSGCVSRGCVILFFYESAHMSNQIQDPVVAWCLVQQTGFRNDCCRYIMFPLLHVAWHTPLFRSTVLGPTKVGRHCVNLLKYLEKVTTAVCCKISY